MTCQGRQKEFDDGGTGNGAIEPLHRDNDSSARVPPDPFMVVSNSEWSAASAGMLRRLHQGKRRADILAGARRLLASEGINRIGMRSVADVGHVAVQTIYNLVGDRTLVLGSAVVEYVMAMAQFARTQKGYPCYLIALCDTYWQSFDCHRDYMRNATLTYFPPDRPLYAQIHDCGTKLFESALQQLVVDGSVREGVEPASLAPHMNSMVAITMLDGVSVVRNTVELRRELLTRTSFMLMNIVNAPAAAGIDSWLQQLKDQAFQKVG
jgi:AcrR family transcriptional regulator